jgi:hypothetical protein
MFCTCTSFLNTEHLGGRGRSFILHSSKHGTVYIFLRLHPATHNCKQCKENNKTPFFVQYNALRDLHPQIKPVLQLNNKDQTRWPNLVSCIWESNELTPSKRSWLLLCWSKSSLPVVETHGSSPCSQQPNDEFNLQPATISSSLILHSSRDILILLSISFMYATYAKYFTLPTWKSQYLVNSTDHESPTYAAISIFAYLILVTNPYTRHSFHYSVTLISWNIHQDNSKS